MILPPLVSQQGLCFPELLFMRSREFFGYSLDLFSVYIVHHNSFQSPSPVPFPSCLFSHPYFSYFSVLFIVLATGHSNFHKENTWVDQSEENQATWQEG